MMSRFGPERRKGTHSRGSCRKLSQCLFTLEIFHHHHHQKSVVLETIVGYGGREWMEGSVWKVSFLVEGWFLVFCGNQNYVLFIKRVHILPKVFESFKNLIIDLFLHLVWFFVLFRYIFMNFFFSLLYSIYFSIMPNNYGLLVRYDETINLKLKTQK